MAFNSSVSQRFFSWQWAARTLYISLWGLTTNCRLYSNIAQILLTTIQNMGDYNKFDSTKSLGCYWYVKIPQCGCMEHGLKHITFYVQKHITSLALCYNPSLVGGKPLGVQASVKLVYWLLLPALWLVGIWDMTGWLVLSNVWLVGIWDMTFSWLELPAVWLVAIWDVTFSWLVLPAVWLIGIWDMTS